MISLWREVGKTGIGLGERLKRRGGGLGAKTAEGALEIAEVDTADHTELPGVERQVWAGAEAQRHRGRCGHTLGCAIRREAFAGKHRRQRVFDLDGTSAADPRGLRLAPPLAGRPPNQRAIGRRRKLVNQAKDERPVRVPTAPWIDVVQGSGPTASSRGRRCRSNPARGIKPAQLVADRVDVETQTNSELANTHGSGGHPKGPQDGPARWVSKQRVLIGIGG